MSTIEEFVLLRSSLPKDGTHTMEDHLKAMTMYVYGLESKFKLLDGSEELVIDSTVESVRVADTTTEQLVLSNTTQKISIKG